MHLGIKFLSAFLANLFIGLFLVVSVVSAQNQNFNIQYISEAKPYSGKSYGDIWSEDDIVCLGIFSGYSSFSTPFGVGIYSITNPQSPNLLSVYTYPPDRTHNQFEQGVVRNKIGYFASWSSGGLHIVSLTNPTSPVLLSRIMPTSTGPTVVGNGFARVHTMFLERDFLYEASHVAGIVGSTNVKVFDVSDPSAPVYLQDIATTNTSRIHQMTVSQKGTNTILYTSGWGDSGSTVGQTDIWDVTHVRTQPAVWLGRILSGPRSHSSWPTPDGNALVVCREVTGGEVTIYDISNPTSPSALSVISPFSMGLGGSEMPHNPVVVGNLLFVSWYRHGIQIFNIEEPAKPVRVGSYDTFLTGSITTWEGNWGVDPSLGLNKLLLSDLQRGLFVLDASGVLTGTNNYAPLLIKSPLGQTVAQGGSVTFTPTITGSSLSYQWRFNGGDISGATGSSYTIPFAQSSHSGNYTVKATNASGSITSFPASLSVSVHASAPAITAQPQPQTVYPEQSATFSVAVSGEAPFFYQWRFKGMDIPNETNATYTIPSVQNSHAGNYSVVITNQVGGIISSNALLSIFDSPYINAVVAHPGLQSAIVSWNTTIPTDGKVDFGPMEQSSITGSSPRDTILSTNHSVLLTGLQPATTYNYQVVSRSNGTNFLSGIYQFTTGADTIIIDNTDIMASITGEWTISSSTPGYYGSNYSFANTVAGSPTHSVTYRPNFVTTGDYDVDVSYNVGGNRSPNAPYTISHKDGISTFTKNQQVGVGLWNPLANGIKFAVGTNGFVRVANNASGSVVMADAVRFSYSPDQEFPIGGTVPAWWSEFYFPSPINPGLDHDGDGFSTAQEYILGTAPNSGNHALSVRVLRSGGTANVMFHPMHADRTYTLQQRSSLTDSSWQSVGDSSLSSGPDGDGVFSIALNSETQSFYRISVELSPGSSATRSNRLAAGERRMFVGVFEEPGCGPTRIYAQ